MSEEALSMKSREALRHIRNWLMHQGRMPSMRELMGAMEYKSPRSPMLLIKELESSGFIEKKTGGGYRLVKDLAEGRTVQTVSVPLVGTVTCGTPILAEQNIEAMIPVSTTLAKTGNEYFLLKAKGDSMDATGINDGDLILIRKQSTAENGQRVVALIDDEVTVKEFHRIGNIVRLIPRSTNKVHQPIILTNDFMVQGVVVATIPKLEN
jgi:repressor LexA